MSASRSNNSHNACFFEPREVVAPEHSITSAPNSQEDKSCHKESLYPNQDLHDQNEWDAGYGTMREVEAASVPVNPCFYKPCESINDERGDYDRIKAVSTDPKSPPRTAV